MATLALGVAGAAAGSSIGGSILGISATSIGFFAGSALGGILFPGLGVPDIVEEGPRLTDTKVQTSAYGEHLVRPYGTVRLSGNVIWASEVREAVQESNQDVGGKGGGGGSVTTRNYLYYRSFAIGICQGPITRIDKIWANTELIYDHFTGEKRFQFNEYAGNETQVADSVIESFEGAGNVPAYRGTSYVVFDDMLITEFGNQLPQISFQVTV